MSLNQFQYTASFWISLVIFSLVPFTVKAACDFSESEDNGTFESADLVSGDCIDNQSGLGISGRISNLSDVDVYKIHGSFNNGDVLDVVYLVGGSDTLATGIFRPDGNLLIVNDHRNVFKGANGPNTNFKFYNNEEFVYLSVSVTPGYYEVPVNYTINIKRSSGSATQPRPQWLLLDFKGANGVRIGSRPPIDTLPLSGSWLATAYPGQIDYIKGKIVEQMKLQMANFNIGILTTDDPIPNNLIYSTVYFGAYDSALLGVAEGVDEYNASDGQNAIVFVETFKSFQYINPTVDEISIAIANVGSHEAGHLMGLVHTSDPQDLLDVTASLSELLKEQNYRAASLYQAVYPIGAENSFWLLGTSIGRKALDLAILLVTLDNLGVSLRICNYSVSDLSIFPLQISINNITKSFNAGPLNSFACQDKRYPYSMWGIIYDQRVQYIANAMADPNDQYKEFDENNNWQSTSLGSSVSVLSPNGGETFTIGSPMEIKWSSSNVGAVNIYLIGQNGNRVADIAPPSQPAPNYGSYVWYIPPSIPAGNYYAVQVVDAFHPATYDFSDHFFSIGSGPSISVFRPTVDDIFIPGSNATVAWQSANLPVGATVSLNLLSADGYQSANPIIGIPNTGSYATVIPSSISPGQYRYEVSAVVNGQFVVGQSNLFTVGPQPLDIYQPTFNFQWLAGATNAVRWNSDALPAGSSFTLKLKNATLSSYYGNTITGITDTFVNYTIPAATPSGQYQFVIDAFKNGQQIVFGAASAVFSVTNQAQQASFTFNPPLGGEQWPINSSQTISWSSNNVPLSNVVHLSIRNEASGQEQTLLNNLSLNYYPPVSVVIPSSVPTGASRVVIRTIVNGQAVSAMSNLINITPAVPVSLAITSPNGGETWPHNSDQVVTWTSNLPASAQVGVFLVSVADGSIRGLPAPDGDYYNNGYQPISAFNFGFASIGDYWLKIESSYNGVTYSDQSDRPIKIGPLIFWPNLSSVWTLGSTQTVWWSETIPGALAIDIDLDNSNGYSRRLTVLTGTNANSLQATSVTVPADAPVGNYHINFIVSTSDRATSFSSLVFQIVSSTRITPLPITGPISPITTISPVTYLRNKIVVGPLTVTAPNSGEVWQLERSHAIEWTPYDPGWRWDEVIQQYIYHHDLAVNPASTTAAYFEKFADSKFTTVGRIIESARASIGTNGYLVGEFQELVLRFDPEGRPYYTYDPPPFLATPGDYYVRVVNKVTGAWDRTDRPLTLAPESSIWANLKINGVDINWPDSLIVPKGGNNTDYLASWTSNSQERCSLDYYFASDSFFPPTEWLWQQIDDLLPNDSRNIRVFPFANVQPGASGHISIYCPTSMSGSGIEGGGFDFAQFYYDRVPSPTIASAAAATTNTVRVTAPNSKENINWSSPYQITWLASTDVETVSIALYKNSAFYRWIARDLPSQIKSYRWTPAKTISGNELGGNYQISLIGRQKKSTGVIIQDKSNAPFSLAAIVPNPVVTPTPTPTPISTPLPTPITTVTPIPISPSPTPIPITPAPAPILAPTLTGSTPPNNAIDARDGNGLGWKFAVLTFSSDLGSDWNKLGNYSVSSTQSASTRSPALTVSTVSGSPYRPIVILSRNINPGERVTIAHKPTGSKVCLGFLPGDVDGNGFSTATDIGGLRSWVGTAEGAAQPLWKTDINRDGVFDAKDVTRAGEVLSVPDAIRFLPACPAPLISNPSQAQLANALSAMSSLLQMLQQSLGR